MTSGATPQSHLLAKLDEMLHTGHLLFHNGKPEQAHTLWKLMARSKADILSKSGMDALGLRVLSGRWVQNIGHFSFLDAYLKLFRLGKLAGVRNIVLYTNLYPGNRISNLPMLKLFSGEMEIRTAQDCHLGDEFRQILHWLREDYECVRLNNQEILTSYETIILADRLWREAKLPPLVELSAEIEEAGQQFLRAHGLSDKDWFVALHAREPGYNGSQESVRDCDIRTYRPVFSEVRKRGGWVIRLGHNHMHPLEVMDGVIDYAAIYERDPRVDIFLSARCRAFIGCASGLEGIPNLFGIPLLQLNHAPLGERPLLADTYFAPKRYFSRLTGQRMRIDELVTLGAGVSDIKIYLDQVDVDVRDLDETDVFDAVTYFLAMVLDNKTATKADVEAQVAYSRHQDEAGIIGTGRIIPELAMDYFKAIGKRGEARASIPEMPFLVA